MADQVFIIVLLRVTMRSIPMLLKGLVNPQTPSLIYKTGDPLMLAKAFS